MFKIQLKEKKKKIKIKKYKNKNNLHMHLESQFFILMLSACQNPYLPITQQLTVHNTCNPDEGMTRSMVFRITTNRLHQLSKLAHLTQMSKLVCSGLYSFAIYSCVNAFGQYVISYILEQSCVCFIQSLL